MEIRGLCRVSICLLAWRKFGGSAVGGQRPLQNGITTGLGRSTPEAVNDLGQIVGGSPDPGSGQSDALLWREGLFQTSVAFRIYKQRRVRHQH